MQQPLTIASLDPLFRSAMREQLEHAGIACTEAEHGGNAPAIVDLDTLPGDAAIGVGSGAPTGHCQTYLAKPVRLAQLLLAAGALASRNKDAALTLAGIAFNPAERLLHTANGVSVALTEKESGLLLALAQAKGEVVARAALLESVWGYGEDVSTHTLETHIYRLRAKLKDAGVTEDRIAATPEGYGLRHD